MSYIKHLEIQRNQPCHLDYTIIEDEIRAAGNKLKKKTSPFSDKIKIETIKAYRHATRVLQTF